MHAVSLRVVVLFVGSCKRSRRFLKRKSFLMGNLPQYEFAVGDLVSLGLCSDLFSIKSDFQANTRSHLYLYGRF